MLLSIITITKDNPHDLASTETSVRSLVGNIEFEWIVINGGRACALTFKPAKLVEESDTGIYDAMLKGLQFASGDYVQFLNSGDVVINPKGYRKISECLLTKEFELVKTHALMLDPDSGRFRVRYARTNFPWIYHGVTSNQQATFYKLRELSKCQGAWAYRVCGDYALEVELVKRQVSSVILDILSVAFERGGVSSKRMDILNAEANAIQREQLKLPFFLRYMSRLIRERNGAYYNAD